MPRYNQKDMTPKSNQPDKSRKGFITSRGHHLNKDIITYFGPGQTPEAIAPGNYSPSGNWPNAGSLLRVPQVINLVLVLPYVWRTAPALSPDLNYEDLFLFSRTGETTLDWGDFTINLSSDWDGGARPTSYTDPITGLSYPAGRMDVQGQVYSDGAIEMFAVLFIATGDPFNDSALWKDEFVVPRTPPGSSGWYGATHQTVDNPFPAEYNRLLREFLKAKLAIEKLRSGRTYVNIIIPFQQYVNLPPSGNSFDPWSNYGNYVTPKLDPDDNPIHFPWQQSYFNKFPGYYWPYLCPTTKFFGTNLLTLYCGCPATTEQIIQNFDSFFDITPANLARDRTLRYMTQNHQYFSDLAIRFYGLELPINDFSSLSGVSAPMVDPPNTFAGIRDGDPTDYPIYFDSTGTFPNERWGDQWAGGKQHFVDDIIYNQNLEIDSLNNLHRTFQGKLNNMLMEDFDILYNTGIDAQYSGVTSNIDARVIANIASAHFQYNDNGKDLR